MNDELPPRALLTAFLLEQIAEQSVSRRILLYRALAVETHDKQLAAECRAQAAALETVEQRERQMLLNFKQRNS